MGKESAERQSGQDETQAHNISSRQKEDRSGTTGKVGEDTGQGEEGGVGLR